MFNLSSTIFLIVFIYLPLFLLILDLHFGHTAIIFKILSISSCDLFLSIHLNAEDSGVWRGAQVFYNDGNKKNKQIAEILQSYFKKNLNSTREYKKSNDLYLQKRIEKTGVLIEVGFLSNPSDRYLLKQKSYHNRVSNIISQAIIEFFQKNS